MKKIACIIQNDSKRVYAYVRSKQNVQDKVGPIEDNENKIKAMKDNISPGVDGIPPN